MGGLYVNYATIKRRDVANGPGVRVSLFVSGCEHRCPGCFNPEAWDFDYGRPFTRETEDAVLADLAPDFVKGLSLLGGEPFDPRNQPVLAPFLRRVRAAYPDKTVWCYTGYLLDRDLRPGGGRGRSTPRTCSGTSMCWWTAPLSRRRRTSPSASGAPPTSAFCGAPGLWRRDG